MEMKIIYLRTSTQDQNPKNQLRDCKKLIEGDFEVVEEKQSAFKDKGRPLFENIKKRISSREIKHLIVWDWDRLFRNQKKLVEFFKFCNFYKCEIHSFNQQYFEDFYKIPKPFDEIVSNLVLNLMGWLAEEESKKKSDRVKIAYKNHKGKWGRKALSKNVISEVMQLSNSGMSIREISQSVFYWDKNKNRKQISKSAVHKIIKENTLNQ